MSETSDRSADRRSASESRALVELSATDGVTTAHLEIAVEAGGRVRQIHVEREGQRVALLSDSAGDEQPWSTGWGCFPMTPWAGRIRNGRFTFLGEAVHLDLNHDDSGAAGGGPIEPSLAPPDGPIAGPSLRRHSIHGTTFQRPWQRVHTATSECELQCRLTGELEWPFAGHAHHRIELRPDRATLTLRIEADDAAFPGSIGWHPWFAKPDRLDFAPLAMYAVDDLGLPTGELVTPPPGPMDDCFINREPVRLHYDRSVAPEVSVSSDCDHWVIYDEPADATCVEPQSGPPDAATLRPEIVAPGFPLARTMTITW